MNTLAIHVQAYYVAEWGGTIGAFAPQSYDLLI